MTENEISEREIGAQTSLIKGVSLGVGQNVDGGVEVTQIGKASPQTKARFCEKIGINNCGIL